MSAMIPPEKRWRAIHGSGSILRQSATAGGQSVISSFQGHMYGFATTQRLKEKLAKTISCLIAESLVPLTSPEASNSG